MQLQKYQEHTVEQIEHSSRLDPFRFNQDPWRNMQQWQEHVDQLFESMLESQSLAQNSVLAIQTPKVELEQDAKEYRVKIQLAPDHNIQLEAEVDGNRLYLSGTTKVEQTQNNNNPFNSINASSQFERTITLAEPVDGNKLSIEHKPEYILVRVPKLTWSWDKTLDRSNALMLC